TGLRLTPPGACLQSSILNNPSLLQKGVFLGNGPWFHHHEHALHHYCIYRAPFDGISTNCWRPAPFGRSCDAPVSLVTFFLR
uniref:Uncharacterized protein n=1 Tax=Aegilops tauschii subsp. strangulata TaxID=200361 RepID=A0A453LF15_AEGTS